MRLSPPLGFTFLAWLMLAVSTGGLAQTPPPDPAVLLLTAGQKAYGEKNLPFARDRFREFLQKFGGHAKVNEARYGLALTLIEGPDRDFKGAVELLNAVAGDQGFVEYPSALYFRGYAHRGLGIGLLAQGRSQPNEMANFRNQAHQHFAAASQSFAAAAAAFAARVKVIPPDAKELPSDLEWAARARCDQAEMDLRLRKFKEAVAAVAPLLTNGDPLTKSRSRPLALYYHGFAAFLQNDYPTAARSLDQLQPYTDPIFGTHARYLRGRIHQHDNERKEAAEAYEAVVAEYQRQKQAAPEVLKNPLPSEEKARLEALLRDPPPDHVARARFFAASLVYEAGRYAEALNQFGEFLKSFPNHPLTAEVQLRIGFCQVQTKQYAEAEKTLRPIAEKVPELADQALFWLARAQGGNYDPAKPETLAKAQQAAIATLRAAIDRSGQLLATDPTAKKRRVEALVELADWLQQAGQAKDASPVYEQLLNEKLLPDRTADLLHRWIVAVHLSGDYVRSDQLCDRFRKEFADHPLMPAVLFRTAENAYFTALAVEKDPNRKADVPKLLDEAAKRYAVVIEKYPEFDRVGLARYGVAMALYRKGDFEGCQKALEAIAAPDRTGDLAVVPYLLGECRIRQAPLQADDAVVAARAQEHLAAAATHLDAFVTANPTAPEAADALLKLGHVQQRLTALLAQPMDKQLQIAAARASYDKLLNQYKTSPLVPAAIFERAKVLAMANDKNGAIQELRRFLQDGTLQTSEAAPLAVVQLATLLREQNQAGEAVKALTEVRQRLEGPLSQNPTKVRVVALMRYHHGVALMETQKFSEARGLFTQVAQSADKVIAAEAALRVGQTHFLEGKAQVDAARQKLATPNLPPPEKAQQEKAVADGLKAIADGAAFLEQSAESFKAALPEAESRARMLYDAAWAYRTLAETQVIEARAQLQKQRHQTLLNEAKKNLPPGTNPPTIPLPDVARAEVPVQPAEQKARGLYQALIDAFGDLPLAGEARFELAELLAERDEHKAAVELLQQAIDKEPPPELTERIRLRLGVALAAMKDLKGAYTQFDLIAQNTKSPVYAQAMYRAGEAALANGEADKAVERLVLFRDKPEFHNVPGLSDRALLRLGHAYARLEKWEDSRKAHETLLNRFGQANAWSAEARYGMGWALQKQNRFDEAIAQYAEVVKMTATELAAKAQMQIGLCYSTQNKLGEAAAAFLVVPFTYDYADLSAASLMEAAQCFARLKQTDQAVKVLQQVVRKYPNTEAAKAAAKRLDELKKPTP